MPHAGSVEALLFVTSRPVSIKKLALILSLTREDVECALQALEEAYATRKGIVLSRNGDEVQLTTHSEQGAMIAEYLKEDANSELTRPALETLAVIAYRGPVTKAEIEHIRGVQSWQSLRNLLMRGLIDEMRGDSEDESRYTVSMDLLHHMGIQSLEELPDFEVLKSFSLDVRSEP